MTVSATELFRAHGCHYIHCLTQSSSVTTEEIPGCGLINYFRLGRDLVHFADPVCDPSSFDRVLTFLEAKAKSENARLFFMFATERFASICAERGYLANSVGMEASIDLRAYKFSSNIRRKRNLFTRQGGVIRRLVVPDRDSPVFQDMEALSRLWMETKSQKKELRLFVGTLEEIFLKDPIILGAYNAEELIGFMVAYPFWQNGKVLGYSVDMVRRHPFAVTPGITESLYQSLAEVMTELGAFSLSLGWLPLYLPEREAFRHSSLLRSQHQLIYQLGNKFYAFKNLSHSKNRFHPVLTDQFIIFRRAPSLGFFIRLLGHAGITLIPAASK